MATPDPAEPPPPAQILVVDNELVIRRLLTMYLVHSGFPCESAASGEEALGIIGQDPTRFRLVITDLDMPHMNGLELATLLREKYPALRVLIVSGTDNPPSISALKSIGNTAFLHKPVTKASLVDAVAALLVGWH